MKSLKILVVLSLFSAGALFAGAEQTVAPASKQAGCCVKAEAAGGKCSHGCCIEAAKAGDNCEKCKGSGKIEKKPAEKTK
ncbi:MAG: hypothetical protein EXS42_10035 [Lacunisphaera sp.]|nr:hypothetical protein [Lacunisphaera sp.]